MSDSRVPRGVDLAAAWSWRLLVIGAAVFALGWLIAYLSVVVIPVVIAVLLAALLTPAVNRVHRGRIKRGTATAIVLIGVIVVIGTGLTLVGQQILQGFSDLTDKVVQGLDQVQSWLTDGPLEISEDQLNELIDRLQSTLQSNQGRLLQTATEVGMTLTHLVAGFFITLFALIFFLFQGELVWRWVVRLMPAAAREHTRTSGEVAWRSLKGYVRATILVALVDAVGITVIAVVLQVPLAVPIGVLVFLTAFIPIVGATLSGAVAVLVALVSNGPVNALLMLGGVIAVQQLESHILQPFLMGRAVRVHPLAVLLAIAVGALVAGIIGALVAVPLAATANAVVHHLARVLPAGRATPGSEADALE